VGWAVSLLNALRLWGLTCPTAPTGVSHIRSNQPYLVFLSTFLKQQSFRKEPFKKAIRKTRLTAKNGGVDIFSYTLIL